MGGTTVNPDQAKPALGKITGAATQASTSATNVGTIQGHQVVAKWGVEVGPSDFMDTYSQHLHEVQKSLTILKADLEDFESAMRSAIQEFVDTDNDSAARSKIIAGQGQTKNRDKARKNSATGNIGNNPSTNPNGPTGGGTTATPAAWTAPGSGAGVPTLPTLPALGRNRPMAV